MPRISVVMAVYNGEKHLKAAMDSLLSQTLSDFECIVIDDASTDATPMLLAAYAQKDARVKVYRNEENLRLAASLNRGVRLACGEYIVRMDADDICLPDRLQRQLAFMQAHTDIGLSYCKHFLLRGDRVTPCGLGRRCDAESVRAMFLFFDPVLHPGVIVRRALMQRYAYDPARTCTEDMDLWTRMLADGVRIACQDAYLMLYRVHDTSITATTKERQAKEVAEIERVFYERLLFSPTAAQLSFFIDRIYFPTACDLAGLCRFYRKILAANRRRRCLSARHITYAMTEILAEQRRLFSLGKKETLSMLRFGGLRFLTALVQRKRRAAADIAAARAAADAAGLMPSEMTGAVPVYTLWEETDG